MDVTTPAHGLTSIPALLRRIGRWLVHTSDKIPHYADGGQRSGKLDAPADVARLASFKAATRALAGSSYAGVGFALGEGVGGIDLDKCIDENGVLADWAAAIVNTLDSYTEVSPSGRGLHILVQYPKEKEWRALGANGTGVEFYSGKRYFTMTGKAIHKPRELGWLTPERYAFLVERHEPGRDNVVALPPRAGALRAATEHAPDVEWMYHAITLKRELHNVPAGKGRDRWRDIGMGIHYVSGGGEDGFQIWHEWSATRHNNEVSDTEPNKGKPVYRGEENCREQWASFKAKDGAIRWGTVRMYLDQFRPKTEVPERELPGALPKDFALDDLDTMAIPETQWIVDGLIAPGLTLLAAPAKQGKSYWALQSCICVGAGLPFMARAVRVVRTTYFDLEEWHRLLKERVDAIKKGHGLTGKKLPLVNVKLETGTGDAFLADLQQEYDRGSRYIVVDVFARVRDEVNENAKVNVFARDYAVIAKLADFALAHPDLALLVVHHGNKGKHDEWQNKISGSMGIAAASHTNLYMARPDLRGMTEEDKEDALRYRVLHGAGKLVREQDFALEMMTDGGGWQVSAFKPWEISTTRKQKDVLFLLASEDRAFSSAEVAKCMGMQGAAAKRLLWRMAKAGTIDSDGRGGDGYRLKRR